jgi:hypothetical protein
MLENRAGNEQENFFHYEDGKLAGFLGSYGFGNKVELCEMVHPDKRRVGTGGIYHESPYKFLKLFKADEGLAKKE